jgi:hypothetical protein
VQVGNLDYRLRPGGSLYFNAIDEHQVIPISKTVKYINVFA